jgi:hypothetical protein
VVFEEARCPSSGQRRLFIVEKCRSHFQPAAAAKAEIDETLIHIRAGVFNSAPTEQRSSRSSAAGKPYP